MYAIPATGPLFLWRVWGDIKISDYSFEKYADDPMIKVLCDEREMDIRRSGLEGEEAAQGCLSSLGDDCYVFTNLYIPYEGKDSETDILVVSPAGVTIVEVKNHKGVIRGDVSDRKLIQDCGLSGEQAEQYAKYVAEAYEERSRMEYDRFPEENCLQTLKEAQRICAGRSKGETLSAHMIDRFLRVPCEQWQMAKTAVSQYFGCGEDAVDRLYSENEEWLLVSAASASALAEQLLALFDADLSWRIFRNAALLGTEAAMTRISAVLDLMGEEFGGKVIRVDAEADGWLFYRYYSDPVGCIAYMKTCGLTAEGILKAVQNDPLVLYLYKEDRRVSYNHDQSYIDSIIQKYK